jgi:Transposase DDE domain
MGLSSSGEAKETAMAEPGLSTLTKLTEFFSTEQIEASARQTGFVQRASKITGKVFLALVTFGPWSTPKTSLAQLAAKAGQLPQPVAVSPEAIHQRLNRRALAFLQEMIRRAFAKLHAGHTVCEEGLFTPFARVHIADSTGFRLPDTLHARFPGAGGSAGQAGAKLQLVWEYKSSSFAHFALLPWNIPDNKYVDTVVALAQAGALFLFDLGYFKLTAFAQIAAAQAYFLSRLSHQTTLYTAVAGRVQEWDLVRALRADSRALLEQAIYLGAQERVAARLIAARMPQAVVNARRRQARQRAKERGYTPSHAHLTLLAWNLFITNVPGAVWTPETVCKAYPLRWQVELIFKSWKSYLHLATLTTRTADTTLCYLYGRLLRILLTYALCPPLRAALWEQKRRELSVLKLVRHLQAVADQWLQVLFQSEATLRRFLFRACASANRLVAKAARKRRTSAQLLHERLSAQNDCIAFTTALAA